MNPKQLFFISPRTIRSLVGIGKNARLFLPIFAALFLGACANGVKNTSRTFNTVIVDAGHGGHDLGARSRYAGPEKVYALDVAQRVNAKLRAEGFKTVMTRSSDKFVTLDGRARISNRQSNAVFVSVHFNYSTNRRAQGVEVHYKHRYASALASNVVRSTCAATGAPSRGTKTSNFRVLKKNEYPAILVECGFLTNAVEGRRCASAAYRERLAQGIVDGILRQRGR